MFFEIFLNISSTMFVCGYEIAFYIHSAKKMLWSTLYKNKVTFPFLWGAKWKKIFAFDFGKDVFAKNKAKWIQKMLLIE